MDKLNNYIESYLDKFNMGYNSIGLFLGKEKGLPAVTSGTSTTLLSYRASRELIEQ